MFFHLIFVPTTFQHKLTPPAQQRLFLLRKLKKANVPSQLLQEYNRKHSLPLYYCVVYQLHYTEPKRSCTDS